MGSLYWESPDGKIKKSVLSVGVLKCKPTEGTKCTLEITDSSEDLSEFSKLTIGDVDGNLGRQFEICVTTMFEKEKSSFVLNLDRAVSFTLEFVQMEFGGFIYEWDAKQKYDYAQFQNNQGKKHFTEGNTKDAGFRFHKGLKIISSIPINVENPPEDIDGLSINEINQLKATLYNNLASCFFRKEKWNLVLSFCDKVFIYDNNNTKALYRAGVSHIKDRNYEKADEYLKGVLEKEPNNKSAIEYHKFVTGKLKEAKDKCDIIAKKMIGDILKCN